MVLHYLNLQCLSTITAMTGPSAMRPIAPCFQLLTCMQSILTHILLASESLLSQGSHTCYYLRHSTDHCLDLQSVILHCNRSLDLRPSPPSFSDPVRYTRLPYVIPSTDHSSAHLQ